MSKTDEILADLVLQVKEMKEQQVKRSDVITHEGVRDVVREVVGSETFKINRRLLLLEKKEDDRAEREGIPGGSKGKEKGKKKLKTKKTSNMSTEFTDARRSIRFTPCGPTEAEVRHFMENELSMEKEVVKSIAITNIKPRKD